MLMLSVSVPGSELTTAGGTQLVGKIDNIPTQRSQVGLDDFLPVPIQARLIAETA